MRKIYVTKKRKAFRRNNAAFNDLGQLVLTCCDSGCLLKDGVNRAKAIIRQQRNMLYEKQYNEQNYLLSKLMDITLTFRGKIVYRVPSLEKVCKTAFRKVCGVSWSKDRSSVKEGRFRGAISRTRQKGTKDASETFAFCKKCSYGLYTLIRSCGIALSELKNWSQEVLQLKHFDAPNVARNLSVHTLIYKQPV